MKENLQAKNYPFVISYWFSTHIIGIIFILIGIAHMVNSNNQVADLCNIWGTVLVVGEIIMAFTKPEHKLVRVSGERVCSENYAAWKLTLNFLWIFLALIISIIINNIIWLQRTPDVTGLNTGGLAIIIMGISVIRTYHAYHKKEYKSDI